MTRGVEKHDSEETRSIRGLGSSRRRRAKVFAERRGKWNEKRRDGED